MIWALSSPRRKPSAATAWKPPTCRSPACFPNGAGPPMPAAPARGSLRIPPRGPLPSRRLSCGFGALKQTSPSSVSTSKRPWTPAVHCRKGFGPGTPIRSCMAARKSGPKPAARTACYFPRASAAATDRPTPWRRSPSAGRCRPSPAICNSPNGSPTPCPTNPASSNSTTPAPAHWTLGRSF